MHDLVPRAFGMKCALDQGDGFDAKRRRFDAIHRRVERCRRRVPVKPAEGKVRAESLTRPPSRVPGESPHKPIAAFSQRGRKIRFDRHESRERSVVWKREHSLRSQFERAHAGDRAFNALHRLIKPARRETPDEEDGEMDVFRADEAVVGEVKPREGAEPCLRQFTGRIDCDEKAKLRLVARSSWHGSRS